MEKQGKRRTYNYIAVIAIVVFVLLLSVFPVRNNDVWWHMAVGREIMDKGAFITHDPFSFATEGRPWIPQSYLAGILFYLLYGAGASLGLVGIRVALVLGVFLTLVSILRREGVPLLAAVPFFFLVALVDQGRFIVRPHLFEYLFFVLVVYHLGKSRDGAGPAFYLWPCLLQVLWVNTHPSFYLGPLLVLLFLIGEMGTRALTPRLKFLASPWGRLAPARAYLVLLVLMVLASLATPRPLHFILQPLNRSQIGLVSSYTLEWRSPFDPALGAASFHPYYEILLGLSALVFLVGLRRLHLGSLLMVAVFAALSLQAHRFRVEFSLAALPLVLLQLREGLAGRLFAGVPGWQGKSASHDGAEGGAGPAGSSGSTPVPPAKRSNEGGAGPAGSSGAGRLVRGAKVFGAVLLFGASGVLVYAALPRISVSGTVSERYPEKAFAFVKDQRVARRPFTTIGYGSFLLWSLYPERRSFIDGRNFAPDVYRDFLDCQRGQQGFERVVEKYDLDSFILPVPEKCDKGMRNVHYALVHTPLWALVYFDRIAFVYVRRDAVDARWLREKEYRYYNTMTFQRRSFTPEETDTLVAELVRAVTDDPSNLIPWVDLGSIYAGTGRFPQALETFKRAREIDPANPFLWHKVGQAAMAAGKYDEAVAAFAELTRIDTKVALAPFNLANAREAAGDTAGAVAAYEEALRRDRSYAAAFVRLFALHKARGDWEAALNVADRFYQARPYDYRSSLQQATCHLALGRKAEAEKKAKEAVGLDEGNAGLHVFLSSVYLEEGKYAEAVAEAKRAVELQKGRVGFRLFLARILARVGDADGARAEVRRVMEMAPESAEAKVLADSLGVGE